jgi:hypothetical protein
VRNAFSLLLLVVAVCLAPAAAQDEMLWDSGNAFVRFCSSMDKPSKEGTGAENLQNAVCASYVSGLDDGVQLELSVFRVESKAKITGKYCYSGGIEGIEQGQIVRILLKYIRNNPEKAHDPVPVLFLLAMQEAFPPCPEKK